MNRPKLSHADISSTRLASRFAASVTRRCVKEWSLYWRDRNLKFHEYNLAEPTPHLDELIEEVKLDRTGIFWG